MEERMHLFAIFVVLTIALSGPALAAERCTTYRVGSEKSGRVITRCYDRESRQRVRCETYRIGSKKSGRLITRCR
jgi:hypothetical protein